MRSLKLEPKTTQQVADWLNTDPKMLKRILQECCRTPFEGIGKPEPLKGELKNIGREELMTNTAWCIK